MISALASFPTRSLFSAPGLLQIQHCTPVRCPSTAQLCHRCTFTLCCGIQQQLCTLSSCPMFPTPSLFPAHTHDFSSCPVSPVKFYNKLTPVISALAVSAHIFILSSLSISAPALCTLGMLGLHTALAQTPPCPVLWVPAAALHCQCMLCVSPLNLYYQHTLHSFRAPPLCPHDALFPTHVHDFGSCNVFPQNIIESSHQ